MRKNQGCLATAQQQLPEYLEQQIWELLDGLLAEQDVAPLASLLYQRDDVRQIYISCALLHADLLDFSRRANLPPRRMPVDFYLDDLLQGAKLPKGTA